MESAKKDMGGDATVSDHLEDLSGLGLSNGAIQKGNQGLVLRRVFNSLLCRFTALFADEKLFNHPALCVAFGLGITFPQVGVSHLFGHCRQGSAHESCVQNPLVLLGILGLEAGMFGFSLGFVHKVEVP